MSEETIRFDWETVIRPPFGVWHRISDDLEARVMGMDEPGTLRVRRAPSDQSVTTGYVWVALAPTGEVLHADTSANEEAFRQALRWYREDVVVIRLFDPQGLLLKVLT